MDEKRLRGLMGLSVRAGQAVFGEDGCLRLLRSDGCGVLLMDETIVPKFQALLAGEITAQDAFDAIKAAALEVFDESDCVFGAL